MTHSIRAFSFPEDRPGLARLCWAYRRHLASLGGPVSQAIDQFYPQASFDALIVQLPQKHARPKGSILVVESDAGLVGCGMIAYLSSQDAEFKRVFIDATMQGTGAGEALSRALIKQARDDGYRRVLLDTTRVSTPARRLYEKLGFQERGPYSAMPPDLLDHFVFYELTL